jgi:hypothetical protein
VAKTSWEDATTSRESAFTMRGVERRGTAGVERGGGVVPSFGVTIRMTKNREEMGPWP